MVLLKFYNIYIYIVSKAKYLSNRNEYYNYFNIIENKNISFVLKKQYEIKKLLLSIGEKKKIAYPSN